MKPDNDSSDKIPNHRNSVEVNAFQLSETTVLGHLITTDKQQASDVDEGDLKPFYLLLHNHRFLPGSSQQLIRILASGFWSFIMRKLI